MTAKIDGTNGVLQAYDYQVLTTAFSYTFAAGTQVLVINPAATLATGTITMPASPADGMTITFSSTKIITALTVNANTGQTINNAATTLAAGQSASYVYRAASTAWFPFSDVSVVSVPTAYGGPRAEYFPTVATGQIFLIPVAITSLKITVVGGGGSGAGGTSCSGPAGGPGGGGASGVQWLTGLTPGNTLTIAVGSGGSGVGGDAGGNGGGTSSVASGTQTITTLQCTGGSGGSVGGAGGSSGTATGFSNGTLLTGVSITGTAGQFSCAASSATLSIGQRLTISGAFGGSGTITGYSNPKTYYIIATNGSTTFTLSATYGGSAVTTTAGTPTGVTYAVNSSGASSFSFAGYGPYTLNKGSGTSGGSTGGGSSNTAANGAVLIEY
jgi:hypothetical protein